MTVSGGVLLEALGAEASRLHPMLHAQMSSSGERQEARGVFTLAGSRFRRLNLLGVPIVGRDALVSRNERDVPFVLVTATRRDERGRAALDTVREFGFRGDAQLIADRLVASTHPGLVRDVLGRAGRIELILRCEVAEHGALRMVSERAAVRVAGRRIALRGLLRLDVRVEDGWDAVEQRRTIRMRARNPLAGTVLEYRGWYRTVSLGADDAVQKV